MPQIGSLHPQIVHFAIALLVVGVILRWVSLTGKLRFTSPAATTLIVLGTLAAVLAVIAGDQAHGPVERIPGVREAVVEHEQWGERTRNLFIAIAAIELVGLLLSRSEKLQRGARGAAFTSAALGLVGLFFVYEAGEHGGDIVYAYAGGVGLRSGDPQDVDRLLVAGLYNKAVQDRELGNKEGAAQLITQVEGLRPNDPDVRLLAIESMLIDRNDAAGALAALRGFAPGEDARLRTRAGLLRVDAFEAAGQRDSALAVIQQLKQEFPANTRIQQRAEMLQ